MFVFIHCTDRLTIMIIRCFIYRNGIRIYSRNRHCFFHIGRIYCYYYRFILCSLIKAETRISSSSLCTDILLEPLSINLNSSQGPHPLGIRYSSWIYQHIQGRHGSHSKIQLTSVARRLPKVSSILMHSPCQNHAASIPRSLPSAISHHSV